MAELKSEQTTLKSREQQLVTIKHDNRQLEQSISTAKDEIESLTTEQVDIDNQIVQAESELKRLETETEKLIAKLENSPIKDFAEITDLQKSMAATRAEIEAVEIEIVKLEGIRAAHEIENEKLLTAATELKILRRNQDARIISGDFSSSIIKAYTKWGFVIVEGGIDKGVVRHANLNVYRQGQLLASLIVTHVGSDQSAAEIVPGTIVAGQSINPGDVVLQASKSIAPVEVSSGISTTETDNL